jgi:hypothetical protein
MATKITLFILDDNIYKSQEFVDRSVYDTKIDSQALLQLADSYEWKGQHNLQALTIDILKSVHGQSGSIATYGFTHPAICLDEIDGGLKPDIVIFDWEYGSESNKESSNWLTEILNSTEAFIFVYSQVRDVIPPFLNKQEFDNYAHRFQLFLKGSSTHSIFSSEEFILQYILGKVSDSGKIKIQGIDVEFTSNDYLKKASDILYLERVLGKSYLLEEFKKLQFTLNNNTIENLLDNSNDCLYLSEAKGLLISPDEVTLIEKLKPLKKLSYSTVVKHYSIEKLEETLEKGIALI